MKRYFHSMLLFLSTAILFPFPIAAQAPQTPRIDSVVMLDPQPHENDPAVIWYDDFDVPAQKYGESQGNVVQDVFFGESGQSMLSHYPKGSQGKGDRKVFFGDSPTGNPVIQRGKRFEDVYWRFYVKHQYGWTGGGPAKLSRATSLVSSNWAQAMISHVWSAGDTLTLDPASGVQGSEVMTTQYNDFDHLRWLGNKPAAQFPIHSANESGWWVCVEARAKLNRPGEKDGLNQLWLDGRLEAERTHLDWRGTYEKYGINAVFLETYWNEGSPVTQSRWFDNFVISTKPIGPVVCPRNPILIKTKYCGEGESGGWELELANIDKPGDVVWKSNLIQDSIRVRIGVDTGIFLSDLANQSRLAPSTVYVAHVREKNRVGEWSAWSEWRQPFKTEDAPARVGEWKSLGPDTSR